MNMVAALVDTAGNPSFAQSLVDRDCARQRHATSGMGAS
jgi:hypothetical protein